ncbi:D-lactate dehydrogenase [Microbacterium resistens]|uniref:D-lactate dehydrogenase (cytochrome) n=1 Tax=Microbacterium resistens TaxID=156977 RepID=A0ABU1S9F4_9MICO|nr:FAD-binding and (Fe-S)-binding domain-containing protein [Microbacterium resistens]MDR6866220.1 D-lactate dehydrogenase [Microbacterium resistens]
MTTDPLIERLRDLLGHDAVRDRAIDVHAVAHDASHYLLLPRAVVVAEDEDAVARVLAAANEAGAPVSFRSGGTSLSGQASADGVQIDTRRSFRRITVEDDGATVRVQPGATVRQVNARLARHGRKLGPDPASEIACTIGGVVANNSSGMSCGTERNTYRTIASMRIVLADGTALDTAAPDADERLRTARPELHSTLLALRDRVRADDASVETIRRLFSIKNTMGYGVNALLDFDRPVDILAHLLVGSEGTLGFVAEAVFRTVPAHPRASTALLIFPTLRAATEALPALVATDPAAIELMDAASLRVAQTTPDPAGGIADLTVDAHTALLVEYQEPDEETLAARVATAEMLLPSLPLTIGAAFTSDPSTRAGLWQIRKGLYTTIAGARPSGTTALLEDIAVPVERLADTCSALTDLFAVHGYEGSVVFGHAKDGNIHFMITDRFDTPEGKERLARFTDDMVDLVLGQGGVLKAEHGTGRAMAPFVRRQYGDDLYAVMQEIKQACDPAGILNPGVLLSGDDEAHLRDIKVAVQVEEEVDRCVECGYCEPVCPSRDLTLTPRQRIVVRRAAAQAREDGDDTLAAELDQAYRYDGIDTCAVDGMCQTACPVLINTGDLVRRLRAEQTKAPAAAVWNTAAGHWGTTTRAAAAALSVAKAMPAPLVTAANTAARAVLGADTIPLWTEDLPGGGTRRGSVAVSSPAAGADAVYLPSCQSAMFGPAGDGPGLQRSFQDLCADAGVVLHIPEDIDSLCCGTPWSSKGYRPGKARMQERVVAAVLTASRDGELPVVCDASSCTEGFIGLLRDAETSVPLRIVDGVEFLRDRVLPALGDLPKAASLSVHPTCSSTHLGSTPALLELAGAVAETVHVPESWGCCAFAGDRGMLHPELTASATAQEAAEVRAADAELHASCNRACELGMSRATDRPYRGIIEVLAAASAAR